MFGKQHEHNYKIVGAKSNDNQSLTYVLYRCDCSDVTVGHHTRMLDIG